MKKMSCVLCLVSCVLCLVSPVLADSGPFAKSQIDHGAAYENVWVTSSMTLSLSENPSPSIGSGGNYVVAFSAGTVTGTYTVQLYNDNNFGIGFVLSNTLTADVKAPIGGTSTGTTTFAGETATKTKTNGAKGTDFKYPDLNVSIYAYQTLSFSGTCVGTMSYSY